MSQFARDTHDVNNDIEQNEVLDKLLSLSGMNTDVAAAGANLMKTTSGYNWTPSTVQQTISSTWHQPEPEPYSDPQPWDAAGTTRGGQSMMDIPNYNWSGHFRQGGETPSHPVASSTSSDVSQETSPEVKPLQSNQLMSPDQSVFSPNGMDSAVPSHAGSLSISYSLNPSLTSLDPSGAGSHLVGEADSDSKQRHDTMGNFVHGPFQRPLVAPRRQRSIKRPIPEDKKDERYRQRRQRNNIAARKSREKKKRVEEDLMIHTTSLKTLNDLMERKCLLLLQRLQLLQVFAAKREALLRRESTDDYLPLPSLHEIELPMPVHSDPQQAQDSERLSAHLKKSLDISLQSQQMEQPINLQIPMASMNAQPNMEPMPLMRHQRHRQQQQSRNLQESQLLLRALTEQEQQHQHQQQQLPEQYKS